jgi:hypothetical protein
MVPLRRRYATPSMRMCRREAGTREIPSPTATRPSVDMMVGASWPTRGLEAGRMACCNHRFILPQSLLPRSLRASVDNECFTGKLYVWRAVDSEGEMLDILVQPRRDLSMANS